MKAQKTATNLLCRAAQAARKAHCPYSKFHVGAALLAADGTIFTGCNMENASYGLTICAERSAFCAAIAAGKRKFTAIAIVAGGKNPPYPCGACLQVMTEFCRPDFRILCAPIRALKNSRTFSLRELLPHQFLFQP